MPRKKSPSPGKSKKNPHHSIIEAALNLATQKDWASVTLRDIASQARVDGAELRGYFPSKEAILDHFAATIDARLAEKIDPESATAPIRDQLFELLMARFDLLAEYKDAVRSIMQSLIADPLGIAPGLMRLHASMGWTLEIAGISVGGIRGRLRIQFLSAAFLNALRVWLRDDSPDMAMTMATIDRWINRGEELERRLCAWNRKDSADIPEPGEKQTSPG